jgi:hypothetical protein
MIRSARHFTVLLKLGLPIACFAVVALWPDILRAQAGSCADDSDCEESEECIKNDCQPRKARCAPNCPVGELCQSNSDCDLPLSCDLEISGLSKCKHPLECDPKECYPGVCVASIPPLPSVCVTVVVPVEPPKCPNPPCNEQCPNPPCGEQPRPPVGPPSLDLIKNEGSGHSGDVNISRCDTGRFAGDPINLTTGNRVHTDTDYVGAGPFPLVFSRTYK